MPPLQPAPEKKNRNLLYIGIIAVVVLLVIVAVAGYLYLQDQDKQNSLREGLRQTFGDQHNETDRQYALITGYPAAGNKNYVDDYRKWIDGYRQLADNFSLAVTELAADGAAYQAKLANDSSDYANVTAICRDASNKVKSVNSTAAGYEQEYQKRLGLRTNASADFDLAVQRSLALYDSAWSYMQQSANYTMGGIYHKYLNVCNLNNTYYNNSISLVQSAGATYQNYLKGSDYQAVNTTIASLLANSAKLGRQYMELQKKIPNVTIVLGDAPTMNYGSGGVYLAQSFRVINNGWPMLVSDLVVHFTIVDQATRVVRGPCDVKVDIDSASTGYDFQYKIPCEMDHTYDVRYTLAYEY
jgi:nitric oxide reductase large subunit